MSAWTVIAHTEVGSGGAANIEFGSISSSFTDLYLVLSLRTARSAAFDEGRLYFNGSNTSLSTRFLEGTGSTASSGSLSNGYFGIVNSNTSTSNTFSNHVIYIPNYAGSANKSYSSDSVSEQNATLSYQDIVAGLWSSTDAINKITIVNAQATNFLQYSSATLYGVLKGSSGGVSVS
jgi:hypothetical protein